MQKIRLIEFFIFFILWINIYLGLSDYIVSFKNDKKNLLIVIILLLITVVIIFYKPEELFYCIMPIASYVNTFITRYLLFNKVTKKLGINNLEYPYNPLIAYPGTPFAYWGNKERKEITFLEIIFSFWILIAPFLSLKIVP